MKTMPAAFRARNDTGLRSGRMQRGVSIVELMISMAIGALLIAGLTQVFMGTRTTYELQDSLSRVQENSRFAYHFLAREIRQAGSSGCAGRGEQDVMLNDTEGDFLYDLSPDRGIEGYATAQDLPSDIRNALNPQPLDGSPVLVIRGAVSGELPLRSGQSDGANVHVQTPHNVEQGEILAISDCEMTSTFQVTGNPQTDSPSLVHNTGGQFTPGNAVNKPARPYAEGASIVRLGSSVFYLAQNEDGQPALYRSLNVGMSEGGGASVQPSEELVEGVERLGFEFGLATTREREAGEFRTADEISQAQWPDVVSVRMSLLVRDNRENIRDDSQTLSFMGQELQFDDRRLRHVVNGTVALRNRAM